VSELASALVLQGRQEKTFTAEMARRPEEVLLLGSEDVLARRVTVKRRMG